MALEKEPAPVDAIQAAARVHAFLESDDAANAFALMERRYYEEFKAADSSEARVRAWAKANLLDDFRNQLLATVSAGEAAVFRMQADAKRASQRPM